MISRVMRSSLLDEMGKSYVVAARSTGISKNKLLFQHIFRNAINPVIVILGNYFGGILGGSVIIENIYALPGIGTYAIEAIYSRDYPIIQGYVLVMGAMYVILNYFIDIFCFVVNAKARAGGYTT